MQKTIRTALGLAALAVIMTASAASAQQAPPGRIRGQIEKVDGAMLSLKLRDGGMLNVKVADDARVAALVKASLADIKADTFIGVAGMPQPDGSIKAFPCTSSCVAARRGGRPARAVGCEAGQHHDQRLCREHRDRQGRRNPDG